MVRLVDLPLTIGRGDRCDVHLDDATAASTHARLAPSGGGWRIEDLDSTNGTFVDGERSAGGRLSDGSVVRVGATLCVFESGLALDADDPRAFRTQALDAEVRRLSGSDAAVLLLGPTGAGKGYLAAKAASFVACAARN